MSPVGANPTGITNGLETHPHAAFPAPEVSPCASAAPTWDVPFVDNFYLLWNDLETTTSWALPPAFDSNYPMNFLASTQTTFPEFDPWYMSNAQDRNDGINSNIYQGKNPNDRDNDGGENVGMQHTSGVIS